MTAYSQVSTMGQAVRFIHVEVLKVSDKILCHRIFTNACSGLLPKLISSSSIIPEEPLNQAPYSLNPNQSQ